jgi:microcystin-dependent protein
MSQPFIGEIRIFAGTFAPFNWAFCNGQAMAISQNDALFALIGTTYGGDGVNTFNLPDLQSRLPIHAGQGPGLSDYVPGEVGGVETVTLTTPQMPPHTHPAPCDPTAASSPNPAGASWGNSGLAQYSDQTSSLVAMNPAAIGAAGGGQPHDNMVPFLVVNFIIALNGIFPSRN